MHHLNKLYDKNIQVDIGILDFSKAFDVVPHRRVLNKLEFYGINGNIHAWISAFLHDRTQSVVVDGVSSSPVEVDSGVPQGTLMGPLIFLLHINDLPQHVTSYVRLFADDCLLYRPIHTAEDQCKLQEDFDELQHWGNIWGMKFNAAKCNIIRISRKKTPLHSFYNIGGEILKEVDSCKYLGVTISNNLSWNTHIAGITKKANQSLGFIRRNTKHCPPKTKELAYLTMVRPLIEYCACIWDPHTQKNIRELENIQRRAARIVKNDFRQTSSVTEIIKELNWDKLQDRRRNVRITSLFKIIKGLVAIPVEELDLEFTDSITRRNSNLKLKTLRPNTNVFKNSFVVKTIPDWNKLGQSTVDSATIASFKEAIRKC